MKPDLDLIVRGGTIVTPAGLQVADLAVAHGRIVKIAPEIADAAATTLEAGGRYVFPGSIDAHVHFSEPGHTDWEGIAAGSAALAAGGGTCFFDMPHGSEPPVLDAARLREKRALAEEKSCVDFALWGGLTPRNLDQLAALRDAGAIGLKAFLGTSGVDGFPGVDAGVLREGMKRAARLGLLVAVQAEDAVLAAKFTAGQKAKGRTTAKAWLDARPVEVELAAIRVALELAGETECALHLLQVSSPEGLALVDEARAQRVDVTAETCPHYLLLNDRDVARIGAPARCVPPIRDEKRRIELWADLRGGRIHTLASGHSPVPPDRNTPDNFFDLPGGIAGVQHGFQLMLSAAAASIEKDLPVLAAVLARNVARRFRLEGRKGLLAAGREADFTIVEFGPARTIAADELWTWHRVSAYVGRRSKARVTDTYVRGNAIYAAGRLVNLPPRGRFLTSEKA